MTRSLQQRSAPLALTVALALLALGPALAPGFVLLRDMVFVPEQPVRPESFGLSSQLPRAVPVDGVVALATQVVPGALLQKLVLVAVFVGAGVGAARLVPSISLWARLGAAVAYMWNPYVAERLLLGHWALLVGYAALPWLLRAALDVRAGRRGAAPRLVLLAAVSSLTPTGGILAVLTAAAGAGRHRVLSLVPVLVLQAPWVVAGAFHPASGRSDPVAVDAFAIRAENWAGVAGAVAGLGGVWNEQAVPASRASVLAPLLTLALLVVAAFGLPVLRARWGSAPLRDVALLAFAGIVLALAGAVPGLVSALRWVVEEVPGAGLLRDGHKWLAPYALVLAVGFGLGCERVAAVRARVGLAALALLLPLAALPDLAWGAAGRLEAERYPQEWWDVAALVAADRVPGALVSLPFTPYRSYSWNEDRPVLDPAPRWLDREVVVSDRLPVGDVVLRGEDPRSRDVEQALATGRPLRELGVRYVLVQAQPLAALPLGLLSAMDQADLLYDEGGLTLYRLPGVEPVRVPRPPVVPVVAAYVLAAGVVLSAALVSTVRWVARRRGRRGSS